MGEMLSVKNINVYYGSIHAIKDVSFHVNEGEIVTLIGANGAGKTTTMHAISGLLKLQSGEIDYCGQTISKMEAHKIIRLGLAQVPEGRRVFSGLTVQQNLQMGAYTRRDGKEAIQNDFDMVFDLLPRLKERRNQPAGTLSGGEQQMLAMGRALMCKPKMLLLDEPSMGLSPLLVKEIFKIIRQVNRNGVTVLLVEQNAKMALEIANRAYVLETGTIKMEGEATELANNIEVRKAYLGCALLARRGAAHTVGADSISARAHCGRNSVFLPLINPHAYLIAHKIHRQQPHKRCNQPHQQHFVGGIEQLHQIGRDGSDQPNTTAEHTDDQKQPAAGLDTVEPIGQRQQKRDQQQCHASAGQQGCQTLEGRYLIHSVPEQQRRQHIVQRHDQNRTHCAQRQPAQPKQVFAAHKLRGCYG